MKKFLTAMLTGAMCLSLLAGCSSKPDSTPNATGSTPATSSAASAGGMIRIGGLGPLTGSNAVYGMATKQGAEVAVAEINAMGGVQFDLNYQDDEADPEKSVNAYHKLQGDDMQILYGCTTTGACVAVAAETYNDRYFQLTPSASSTDVTAGKDNMFQVCFTDPNQGTTAANIIKEKNLGTKIAAIYNNGDPYSTGVFNAFKAQADALGLDVVEVQTFPDDTNTDFTVQLGAAKAAGADLVFMPIYYTPASLILNQAKTMNYSPVFFGCDGMDGLLEMKGFDVSLAEGLTLITPFNAWGEDERTVKFVTEYQEAYGTLPNQFAADGYDCIYAIYEAVQKAGVTPEMEPSEVCDKMIDVFTDSSFKVDGLTGSGMTWSANGEVSKAPVVVVVQDGKYVTQ